jgi:hypothetical protein
VLCCHPLGVAIFSLAVNVNVKAQLVHTSCVIVHVGFCVSIHHRYIVISNVEFSSSLTWNVHSSPQITQAFGVYVTQSPDTVHSQISHVSINSSKNIVSFPQSQSETSDNTLQLTKTEFDHTLSHHVKSCHEIGEFVHVNVTLLQVIFHTLSLTCTFTDLFPAFPLYNEYEVSLQKLFQFHLYINGVLPHPLSVATTVAVHVVHSGTDTLSNVVIVGAI